MQSINTNVSIQQLLQISDSEYIDNKDIILELFAEHKLLDKFDLYWQSKYNNNVCVDFKPSNTDGFYAVYKCSYTKLTNNKHTLDFIQYLYNKYKDTVQKMNDNYKLEVIKQ